MKTINVTDTHIKITGSCTECYNAWNDLRTQGWKVHKPMYWGGRGRGFHAALEMVKK